jgi:hypothetical protein
LRPVGGARYGAITVDLDPARDVRTPADTARLGRGRDLRPDRFTISNLFTASTTATTWKDLPSGLSMLSSVVPHVSRSGQLAGR